MNIFIISHYDPAHTFVLQDMADAEAGIEAAEDELSGQVNFVIIPNFFH